MTKTSERISTTESFFEQHSRIFAPSQSYSWWPNLRSSLFGWRIVRLLLYYLMTFLWPLDPKSRLLSQIIRLLNHHKRPLGHHTRQLSPKQLRKLNQMDRPVITLPLSRRCTTIITGTSKGTIHVPRETVSQDTHLWPSMWNPWQFQCCISWLSDYSYLGPVCSKSIYPYRNQKICAGPW